MDPKKIITLFVVLAVIAVGIGLVAMWYQSQEAPDGYYNFSGTTSDSYFSEDDHYVEASENKQFYFAEVTLKNERYSPGLDTKQLLWKLTVDGGTYSLDLEKMILPMYMHKDFILMTFEKGKLWKYTVVFTIPKVVNITEDNTSLSYTYITTDDTPSLSYDKDLRLPDPRTTISTDMFVATKSDLSHTRE